MTEVKKGSKLEPYAVVTDSAADVPGEYARSYEINVVPLYIHYNGQEFRDGIDIKSEKIYSLQKGKKAIFILPPDF
jgi:fatty acid-binding protein DegV